MSTLIRQKYIETLHNQLLNANWKAVDRLEQGLRVIWQEKKQFFVCGNGGSLGNAMHIANDFSYPISKKIGEGIRIRTLGGNPSLLSCLSNDEGYEHVFDHELAIMADEGDELMVLSGSGNSQNILYVLEKAREMGIYSHAILGFDGGEAKKITDNPIHFNVHDMQVAEDLQMIIMNMIMQALYHVPPKKKK